MTQQNLDERCEAGEERPGQANSNYSTSRTVQLPRLAPEPRLNGPQPTSSATAATQAVRHTGVSVHCLPKMKSAREAAGVQRSWGCLYPQPRPQQATRQLPCLPGNHLRSYKMLRPQAWSRARRSQKTDFRMGMANTLQAAKPTAPMPQVPKSVKKQTLLRGPWRTEGDG